MRKRLVCICFVIVMVCMALYANQVTYDYDDIEYRYVKYILQIRDMTGPHDTTPVSGSLLVQNLNKVNKENLPGQVQVLYDGLYSYLNNIPSLYKSKTMMLDLDTFINPEIYLKAGDEANMQDWYYGYPDKLALLSLDIDFAWSEYVYGKIDCAAHAEPGADCLYKGHDGICDIDSGKSYVPQTVSHEKAVYNRINTGQGKRQD